MRRFLLAGALLLQPIVALAAPRPISDAEKAACEAVADHIARGPVAILERLTATSPLLAGGRTAALAEIEARIGPHVDARWELRTVEESFAQRGAVFRIVFPSGIDDIITFELKQERGAWRIDSIRTLADPPGAPLSSAAIPSASVAVLVIVLARKRRKWPVIAGAAAIVFAIVVIFILGRREPPRAAVASAAAPADSTLEPLVALRRALAKGEPFPTIGHFTGARRDVALMWKAQREVGRTTSDKLEQELYGVARTDAPLLALVRARVAAADGRDEVAMKQYALVMKSGPKHDGFWFEEEMTSPRGAAIDIVRRAMEIRSRDADVYYMFSIHQILNDKHPIALTSMQNALIMKPVSRATLVSSGILAVLEKASTLIDLSAPEEPKRIDPALSQSPMRVPAGTQASVTGMFLRLAIGGGRLDVPCGASIAPAGATVLNGEELERSEAEDALRRVEHVEADALASAALQQMLEDAVDVLADQHRWGDILRLTEIVGPESDNVSAELLVARVRALVRAKHKAAARRLATSDTAKRVTERLKNPTTAARLAELLAEAGAYEDALSIYRDLQRTKESPRVARRITQVALRRTLDMSTETAHTPHFEIHSMPDVPNDVPKKFGEQLESELTRLMARFRLAQFRTVRVNILRWNDFRWQVTGSRYVVGFYDGDLTIPWGTLGFGLGADSVMTHELTHAVVAQMTNDNAPRWFQEGIAQRMERIEEHENIFGGEKKKRVAALVLLEPMLESSGDIEDIDSAYVQSQTLIRFLEQRYGEQSINKLIAAYRGGASDRDALRTVTGKTMPDLDREFRAWGAKNTAAFVN